MLEVNLLVFDTDLVLDTEVLLILYVIMITKYCEM